MWIQKVTNFFYRKRLVWIVGHKIVIYVINTSNCWCIIGWSICLLCNL